MSDERIDKAIQEIEDGKPVDWNRLAVLQTLDVASMNRTYAEDSIALQRELDEEARNLIDGNAGRS